MQRTSGSDSTRACAVSETYWLQLQERQQRHCSQEPLIGDALSMRSCGRQLVMHVARMMLQQSALLQQTSAYMPETNTTNIRAYIEPRVALFQSLWVAVS